MRGGAEYKVCHHCLRFYSAFFSPFVRTHHSPLSTFDDNALTAPSWSRCKPRWSRFRPAGKAKPRAPTAALRLLSHPLLLLLRSTRLSIAMAPVLICRLHRHRQVPLMEQQVVSFQRQVWNSLLKTRKPLTRPSLKPRLLLLLSRRFVKQERS